MSFPSKCSEQYTKFKKLTLLLLKKFKELTKEILNNKVKLNTLQLTGTI